MILDYAKRCEKSMLISTIITLVLGIVLIFEPSGSIKVITAIIAILFMLIGAFQLFDYIRQSREEKMMSLSLILGIILFGIGIFLFINLDSLVKFVTTLIGVTICIKSLFKLQFALNIRDISDKWFYNLIVGIVGMILGIVLLVNPFDSAVLFLRIVGVLLVLGSIVELVETSIVLHSLDDAKEIPFEEKKKSKNKEKENEIVVEDNN